MEKDFRALSESDMEKVAGGVEIVNPEYGDKFCSYVNGIMTSCDYPNWQDVGASYEASDKKHYKQMICLNCGCQVASKWNSRNSTWESYGDSF